MLWLRVDGCPRGCTEAADRLDALAARLDAAVETLAADAVLSTSYFDGLAAAAFRTRAGALGKPASGVAADTRGLARALRELSSDLADVQKVMDGLADRARPHLRVLPDRIQAPETPRSFQQDEAAWTAWDALLPLHADARALEATAQADWRAAVGHFTGDDRVPLLAGVSVPVDYDPTIGPHLS